MNDLSPIFFSPRENILQFQIMGRAQDSTLPFKCSDIGWDIEDIEQKNEMYQKESSIYRSIYS